jgi:hypothetical protein
LEVELQKLFNFLSLGQAEQDWEEPVPGVEQGEPQRRGLQDCGRLPQGARHQGERRLIRQAIHPKGALTSFSLYLLYSIESILFATAFVFSKPTLCTGAGNGYEASSMLNTP